MSCRRKLIIFGVSLIGDIVHEAIVDDAHAGYEPAAFCVDGAYLREHEHRGLPVFAFEDIEREIGPDDADMIVAIGYHKMNRLREERCAEAEAKGYRLASYVHPNADVPRSAEIGKNVLILGNASVGAFAKIGDGTSIYPGAAIAHHAEIGRFCWITSGSVVGGSSRVGDRCFVGIHATIGHNITVGSDSFIGANAVITRNTADDGVYIVPDTQRYRLDTARFMQVFKFD